MLDQVITKTTTGLEYVVSKVESIDKDSQDRPRVFNKDAQKEEQKEEVAVAVNGSSGTHLLSVLPGGQAISDVLSSESGKRL